LTYVIDASVALKWFLREEESHGADSLFEAFLANQIELLARDILVLEVANTLWKQSILLKRLRPEEASSIFHGLLTLPLNLKESNALASEALKMAVEPRHPVCDTLYCALAKEHDCEFITADRVLVDKLSGSLQLVHLLSTVTL
jgi:predicted nucleic acid-binding protein